MDQQKIYQGAIVLFYRTGPNGEKEYLVIKNSKTENITFVSGAKEDNDPSLEETAQREIQEELGLRADAYQLIPTQQKHEFVFGPKKAERAGCPGSYSVFVVDGTSLGETIHHTKELKSAEWMTKEQVDEALTFPDLKEVFLNTVAEMDDGGR